MRVAAAPNAEGHLGAVTPTPTRAAFTPPHFPAARLLAVLRCHCRAVPDFPARFLAQGTLGGWPGSGSRPFPSGIQTDASLWPCYGHVAALVGDSPGAGRVPQSSSAALFP